MANFCYKGGVTDLYTPWKAPWYVMGESKKKRGGLWKIFMVPTEKMLFGTLRSTPEHRGKLSTGHCGNLSVEPRVKIFTVSRGKIFVLRGF